MFRKTPVQVIKEPTERGGTFRERLATSHSRKKAIYPHDVCTSRGGRSPRAVAKEEQHEVMMAVWRALGCGVTPELHIRKTFGSSGRGAMSKAETGVIVIVPWSSHFIVLTFQVP